MKNKKTLKLRLTLDVSYTLNGSNEEILMLRLEDVVKEAICNGTLTGDLPAVIVEFDHKVSVLKTKKA